MTVAELRESYWAAMEAAHMVDVITAEAKERIAAQVYESARTSERFNAAMARHLIETKAPAGHGLDIFGEGTIKPIAECKKHPDPEGS